jgi:hypothetical protein
MEAGIDRIDYEKLTHSLSLFPLASSLFLSLLPLSLPCYSLSSFFSLLSLLLLGKVLHILPHSSPIFPLFKITIGLWPRKSNGDFKKWEHERRTRGGNEAFSFS